MEEKISKRLKTFEIQLQKYLIFRWGVLYKKSVYKTFQIIVVPLINIIISQKLYITSSKLIFAPSILHGKIENQTLKMSDTTIAYHSLIELE